ncbi:hypothetical protein N7638_19645 [Achromobacter mucicolens]|uniref:hypothetical protein n=1 Tax=Achromobacter TaxID=222 RepID=UPI0024474A59|nr:MULTISPECIES: hypothetical protein [Achromobacter]MDG9970264.1 hypothetical protein [Achromobacter mucicolens]
MRSLLERPITFRLSAAARVRYEQAAAERGMTLSAYLRDRLEIDDQVAEHVSQLRLTLLDYAPNGQSDGSLLPILLELLLLTRRQSPPAELRAVHHELERQGVLPRTFK